MSLLRYTVLLALLLFAGTLLSQINFREGYEQKNPVPLTSDLPEEERLSIHKKWLEEAEAKGDTLLRIYGEIYLFYDYRSLQDYTAAAEHLLLAESLANASGNAGWRGAVAYRRGRLWVTLRDTKEAIAAYEDAVNWCRVAGDSLCVGESLEQLSAMLAFNDNYPLARKYFYQALPLLERYGKQKNMQTANANFGLLLIQEGNSAEAIPYLRKAKSLASELGAKRSIGKAMNNLSVALEETGQYELALSGYLEAVHFNGENGFPDNIVQNYAGLRDVYRKMGDHESAYDYQQKHLLLRDSLIGSSTKLEIARLEENFRLAEQQLKIEAAEKQSLRSQRRVERIGMVLGVLVLAGMLAFWLWRKQVKDTQVKMTESRGNLKTLTRLLTEKNAALLKLKQENIKRDTRPPSLPENDSADGSKLGGSDTADDLADIHHQTILTLEDWTAFKVQFARSNPRFLERLRKGFPALTEAEERLFLLLKLNLTSKEIADVLGISPGGVKKTRSRLRKRLGLDPKDSLKEFVLSF